MSLLAEMVGPGGHGEIQLWRLPPNPRLLYSIVNDGRIDTRTCLPEGTYQLFGRLVATDGIRSFSVRLRLDDLCPGDLLTVLAAWGPCE